MAVTEIQPTPPAVLNSRAVLSSPDNNEKRSLTVIPCLCSVTRQSSPPFADGSDWRLAIGCLACLMAAALVLTLLALLSLKGRQPIRRQPTVNELLSSFGDGVVMRIALAYGIVAGLSYGSSLAALGYLAAIHGVSMGASATVIAAAKIVAMLLGGVGMGRLLSAERDGRAVLACVCAFGLLAQVALYFPGSGMALASSAMIAWLIAYAAISATSFVALARANKDPACAGMASGIVGQLSSLACVLAPSIYFAVEHALDGERARPVRASSAAAWLD